MICQNTLCGIIMASQSLDTLRFRPNAGVDLVAWETKMSKMMVSTADGFCGGVPQPQLPSTFSSIPASPNQNS